MSSQFIDIGNVRVYAAAMPALARGERYRVEQELVARLVEEAFGPGAVKVNDADGRPWVLLPDGGRRAVSVSHCAACAVIAVGPDGTGIDVETARPQLARVLPRILTQAELALIPEGDMEAMQRAWTLKEALYKAASSPSTDYRRDISILPPHPTVAGTPYTILHTAPFHGAYMSLVTQSS